MGPISDDLEFETQIASFSPAEQFLARQIKGVREANHDLRNTLTALMGDFNKLKTEHTIRVEAGVDCGSHGHKRILATSGGVGGVVGAAVIVIVDYLRRQLGG